VWAVGEAYDDGAAPELEEELRFCPDGVEVYRRWRDDRALWRSEGSG